MSNPRRQALKRYLFVLLSVTLFIPVSTVFAARKKPNVLLICVDDLRPELGCFGVSYIKSPHIDSLASGGRLFRRHYVQAPTCGASRCTLLTGCYDAPSNAALFQRAAKLKTDPQSVPPSMPAWFRQNGYTTVSVGKVSHHPGGLGGKDWDDKTNLEMPNSWDRHLLPAGPWQHPRGWMHGLAHGEIRVKAGDMDVLQALEGPDSIYPDGISVDEAIRQLDQLAADTSKPFFLAVGILRPHLPFGAPAKYLKPYADVELPPTPHPTKPEGKTTWHGSGEFMKYNRWGHNPNTDPEFAIKVRKHYAACVSYADAQVGRLLERLDERGQRDNTIVVLWGDHGWHLGEHAIWGKHALFEESLRSPLIVSYPGLHKPGVPTDSIVETLDLFPTLCEIAGLPKPAFVDGVSLRPQLDNPKTPGHAAIAYRSKAKTIRTDSHRLIVHNDGHTELYDHNSTAGETKNIAQEQPTLSKKLSAQLQDRLDCSKEKRADWHAFQKLEQAPWKEVLVDTCTEDWRRHWSLDGLKATITHSEKGMDFRSGPTRKENASHAVLWTKQSFAGDIRLDYEYTRIDKATEAVTILYIQATGSGAEGYEKDISKWADKREVPTMSTYYRHMNLHHISYAAFGVGGEDPEEDYIRARRYMPERSKGLKETDMPPDYFRTGLFKPDIPHKITVIKQGNDLYLYIRNHEQEKLCHWKTDGYPPIHEGRIGLRHMWTRGARYRDFRISQLKDR